MKNVKELETFRRQNAAFEQRLETHDNAMADLIARVESKLDSHHEELLSTMVTKEDLKNLVTKEDLEKEWGKAIRECVESLKIAYTKSTKRVIARLEEKFVGPIDKLLAVSVDSFSALHTLTSYNWAAAYPANFLQAKS